MNFKPLIILILLLPFVSAGSCYMIGDVDFSGAVSTYDLILISKHILGVQPLVGNALLAADVNGDGAISTLDMIIVRKEILRIEDNDTGKLVCNEVPEFSVLGGLVAVLGCSLIYRRRQS